MGTETHHDGPKIIAFQGEEGAYSHFGLPARLPTTV